jgi:hypothetical protein
MYAANAIRLNPAFPILAVENSGFGKIDSSLDLPILH